MQLGWLMGLCSHLASVLWFFPVLPFRFLLWCDPQPLCPGQEGTERKWKWFREQPQLPALANDSSPTSVGMARRFQSALWGALSWSWDLDQICRALICHHWQIFCCGPLKHVVKGSSVPTPFCPACLSVSETEKSPLGSLS